MEEREQKKFDQMKTKQKLSKAYNERADEMKSMQKDISKANKNKFENSFWGKSIEGIKAFDRKVNAPKSKGKKSKTPKIKREDPDMFGDGDPWA